MPPKYKEDIDLQSTIKTLVNKICTSDEFINEISESIAATVSKKYEDIIKGLQEENVRLCNIIKDQEKTMNTLCNKVEKLDLRLRHKGIRLYGVKEVKNEDTLKVIQDLFTNKLKLHVKDFEIETCYRVAKRQNCNKPRPILVNLSSDHMKKKLYNNKKNLKGTGIVMREDLTSDKLQILKAAIDKVGENGQAWTNNGNIFVKLKNKHDIIKIGSQHDVTNL